MLQNYPSVEQHCTAGCPSVSPFVGFATEHAGPELVSVTLDRPTPTGKVLNV